MPHKNHDLHGNAPDHSDIALLIIDVINDFEFDSGEALYRNALPAAKKILQLKQEAKKNKIPVIYVNDNFGKWQSNFHNLIAHCIDDDTPGKKIAEMLKPDEDDYFVLKPKHSGFFSTTLDTLLKYLDAKTLILTGVTTDICVLFTANDAYMRDYNLVVPRDCVAAASSADHKYALGQLKKVLKADISPAAKIDLKKLKKTSQK